jgi:hypothetical protein
MPRRARLALTVCVLCAGCAAETVSLGDAVPVTATTPREIPLEIVTRSVAVADPLPLDGGRARFSDLETSLGHAVASAATPWAAEHRAQRPDGWQLLVELVHAHAERRGPRLTVTLGARATLRTRVGNRYLAQTQAHCKQSGNATPSSAAPVFYNCMMSIGRELAGWLGGVEP